MVIPERLIMRQIARAAPLVDRNHQAGAARVAEKLRLAVSRTPVVGDNVHFHISASFGVAEIVAADKGIGDCLGRADSALYTAKRAGRNCVMRYPALAPQAQAPGA